jgi:hypothetical protein
MLEKPGEGRRIAKRRSIRAALVVASGNRQSPSSEDVISANRRPCRDGAAKAAPIFLHSSMRHRVSGHRTFQATNLADGAACADASVKLLLSRCGPADASSVPPAPSVAARKVRIGRASTAMEENMQSIRTAFTCATTGTAGEARGFTFFWMMVFAIAILDDSAEREEKRRKRNEAHRTPAGPKPRP